MRNRKQIGWGVQVREQKVADSGGAEGREADWVGVVGQAAPLLGQVLCSARWLAGKGCFSVSLTWKCNIYLYFESSTMKSSQQIRAVAKATCESLLYVLSPLTTPSRVQDSPDPADPSYLFSLGV